MSRWVFRGVLALGLLSILSFGLVGWSVTRSSAGQLHLSHIVMLSQETGWGVAAGGVERTSDGGHTWKQVLAVPTSSTMSPTGFGFGFASYGNSVAWAVRLNSHNVLDVYRTYDAGAHWSTTPQHVMGLMKGFSVAQLVFSDASHGWVLLHGSPGAGQLPSAVLRTSNGGSSWTRMAGMGLSSCDDAVAAISFTGSHVGWATGECGALTNHEAFSKTINGGRSWKQAHAPTMGFHLTTFEAGQVVVAGAKRLLPASISKPAAFVLYRSTAGSSWHETTPIRGGNSDVGPMFSFGALNGSTAWTLVNHTLYRTTDAGSHWYVMSKGPGLGLEVEFDFISLQDGFAVSAVPGGRGSRVIFRTTNSGRTWTKMVVARG